MIRLKVKYKDFEDIRHLLAYVTYSNNTHSLDTVSGYKTIILFVKRKHYIERFKEFLLESYLKGINIEIEN